ncbi:MAG TPA: FdhF/YdeP family oxidoreductase [Pyrinomonadaceae bacterium]|jgi:molybdopterin-dependent oxidoreductase alpha subunit
MARKAQPLSRDDAARQSEEASSEQASHYRADEPSSAAGAREDDGRAGDARAFGADSGAREAAGPPADHAHAPGGAQPPAEAEAGEIRRPPEVAAGIPAAWSGLKYSLREMGVRRSLKTLTAINQKGGFDCPGCAWPEPDGARPHAEFCENGARHVADEATTRRVTPAFFREWGVAALCEQSDLWLNQQGRLTHPMLLRRGSDHYEETTWDEAFRLIASELNALASPNEAVFYTSGRTSNEAAFLYQLFARQFGTNNLPDCSNMCHESSGAALTATVGVGKGTVTLDDFARAEAIFVVGQNPGTNHPRMLTTLLEAKRRGCKIVHVNPLPETGLRRFKHPQEVFGLLGRGTQLSDLFLQVRVNGDVALLKGVAKEVLEEEARRPGAVLDRDFIAEFTNGFDAYAAGVRGASWGDIVAESGVAREEIAEAARVFVASERTIFCWAMGLTQHKNAVANIQEIVNLLLMRGQIGKPGAGACPVRGHSNVQGDRTVGVWERPTETFLDGLSRAFNFEPPREHGFDTVAAIRAMHDRRAKVFFAMGGNFLSATPDTEFTAEALRRTRLTCHVSTKLNRAHLVTGEQALILPCLGRTERDRRASGEQFVSCENSMGVVQSSRGNLEPASDALLSEAAIVARLARATLGGRTSVEWEELEGNYDLIRDAIERVVPGFEGYNRRVREPGGFYLPNGARERKFKTASGRAEFTVHEMPRLSLAPGQFLMMTVRSHDQFNTTIYGLDDRYRGVKGSRRVVFLNPEDVSEAGLTEGQLVDLVSHFEGEERIGKSFRVVPYAIPRRCAATYFPEANVLVPVRHVADKSNTPASKSVVVSLRKCATA